MIQHGRPGDDPETTRARVAELHAANCQYGAFGVRTGEALSTDAVRRVLGYVPTWIHNRAIRAGE